MEEENKRVLILGFGISGRAAARLAEHLKMIPVPVDARHAPDEALFQESAFGWQEGTPLPHADLAVISPGIRPDSPMAQAARNAGASIIGELEFACRVLPCRIVAITGTNGKTTTTELTAALLSAAGVEARTAGNIGLPLSELAADLREGKLSPDALPVVEVSSFQLERSDTFAPFAAALLNLESDHVDRYAGGFEEYVAVKKRIFDRVAPENRVYGLSMDSPVPRRVTLYGDALMIDEEEVLIDLGNTALSAPHNRENLAAAVELCLRVLPLDTVLSPEFRLAIHTFHPGRHRQELVREKDGIRYVNDSKATNPASTVAALRSIPGTVVLLLGGLDKEMDFSPLAPFADRIRFAVLYGECRAKIAAALPDSIPTADCGMEFERAIQTACEHARPGDTVLLAPACASMDLFRDYKERGDRFAAFVKQL